MSSVVIAGNTSGTVTLNAPDIAGSTTLTLPTTSGTLVTTAGNTTVPFALGSAASPSITFTGDTNTGIFSPGADTIGFAEGGAEIARFDSGGDLGIGTTSPAFGLVVEKDNGSGYVAGFRNTSGSPMLTIQNTGGVSQIQGLNSALSATADIALQVSGGNVGIGTSSPAYRIDARSDTPAFFGTASGDGTRFGFTSALPSNSGNCYVGWIPETIGTGGVNGDLGLCPRTSAGANIRFFTGSTSASERMRVTSGGSLLIGTTNTDPTFNRVNGMVITNAGAIYCRANGSWDMGRDASSGTNITFYTDNGSSRVTAGFISSNGSTTTFGTSSDYRLKENIAPVVGALQKVLTLKPVTWSWKNGFGGTNTTGEGFIAHELAEVVPQAVSGEKDGMRTEQYEISPAVPATYDEEGNELTPAVEAVMGEREVPVYQGIDTSFLVATLTAAIQEQQAIITDLKARIEVLENK